MRSLTPALAATAALVIALALLASVSERWAHEVPVGTEAPSAAVHDVRDDRLIACIVPPPAAADEAMSEPHELPCRLRDDHESRMDVQMTEC